MADNRSLHVSEPEYQILRAENVFLDIYEDLSKKLNDTRKKFQKEYENSKIFKNSGDAYTLDRGAKKLTQFFSDIKKYSSLKHENNINAEVTEPLYRQLLIDTINNARVAGTSNKKRLFQTTQGTNKSRGDAFEKELSRVIVAVNTLFKGGKISTGSKKIRESTEQLVKSVNVGAKHVKLEIPTDEIIQEVKDGVKEQLESDGFKSGVVKKEYADLTQKIDASGMTLNWEGEATSSPALNEIAMLLSTANFSAKSYLEYVQDIRKLTKQEIEKSRKKQATKVITGMRRSTRGIGIGETNAFTVFDTLLKDYPHHVAVALTAAGAKSSVSNLMNDIRSMYELTGIGQIGIDKDDPIDDAFKKLNIPRHANYFIFNSPDTDLIVVKSTMSMIDNLRAEAKDVFAKEMMIDRSRFYDYINYKPSANSDKIIWKKWVYK